MSINPLNDISKVYLEQVSESAVPGKPAERLGAVTAIPKSEQDAARERALAKAKAMREKRGIKEAAKPDYLDFDGDGNEKETMKKALKDKKKHKVDEANDGNLANNYPPYDKVTRGDVIAGALGKDQQGGKKKKVSKEGFSNWREDLIEITDKIKTNKSEEPKIVEKEVNNKIKINPNIGEAVENLGGTLLEMVEIDEVDYIVESVYDELLEEGYEKDDIEDALEYALTEAKVTFGHDTSTVQKKRGNLVTAVGRLARQKLSSKVRGAKKAAAGAVARGARSVAKGALGVARKMEGGAKKSTTTERKPSTYRGAGAGTKEKVSSGSYTPPTKKKAEKPSDPWKGSSTVPQKPKPKPKADKPADPWEGSATTPAKPKPKAKTKKAAAPKAKAPAAAAPKRKRKSKLDDLLASVRSEELQFWAEQLVDRGYNLSEYTWDEIYEACEIDEGLRTAIKGLFNRNKKTAEAPKPESRGAELRRKYNVGPEKSDTSAKRKILDKAKNRADLAQSAVDRGDASQSYADKSKEAHQRYLRAGYSKYGASSPHPHGRGSKAAKRAAALKRVTESLIQLSEKTLTSAETKEKERIVKSMKPKASDFERRYPGRGKEVMYAIATEMAKKIAEQAMEIQPKSQQSGQQNVAQKKAVQLQSRQRQQEVQILQRKLQALKSAPKGIDTDITA